MKNAQMYINGQWVSGKATFTSFNPSSGSELGNIFVATREEVNHAVTSARQALPGWRATSSEDRAAILSKAVDLLISRYGQQGEATEFKKLISEEVGKRLPEADIEVIESSDMLAFFAKQGPSLLAPRRIQLNEQLWPTKKSIVSFEPIGVVAIIKPWNYPLELPIWAIGPALIAGNTVVFKPSEHSSFVGLEIGKIFEEAGLPPGVLNIITGAEDTGKHLVRHEGVDMVSFTGSVPVGREIAIECSKRLCKYSLELGGNDAAIIEADVDIELAANGLTWGSFCNSGQVCVRPKRVFVHNSIADKLLARIVEKTISLRLGIDFGPIISKKQIDNIHAQVSDACRKGAELIVGGERAKDNPGFYYMPTILKNIKPDMKLMVEECFGPVLPFCTFSDPEDVVRFANSTKYGLGASIWTGDIQRAEAMAHRLECGMVWINDVNVAFPEAPWGGVKQSGPGVELSEWGLYEYLTKKHINLDVSNDQRRAWWYPYASAL